MRVQSETQNWISTNRAMEIVAEHGISCTRTSLLTWNEKYHLGKKVGGRWYIDEKRLCVFLRGR